MEIQEVCLVMPRANMRLDIDPKSRRKPRFWAKLGDVNKIRCRIDQSTLSDN